MAVMIVLLQLVYGISLGALGAFLGWRVCRRRVHNGGRQEQELQQTREILARVDELTARVATDVGTHQARVEEINEQLAFEEAPDSTTVMAVVGKLVAINSQMQQRLAEAETKLHEQSMALESQVAESRTDALTRLPNRRSFDEEMTRRFAESQRHGDVFSAIMLDVDHFKRINDLHGHQVGDEVLRSIAGVLKQTMRGMDMVARYGGEEFVVVLPRTSITDARKAGERYRQAIEEARFHSEEKELKVTISAGVAQLMPNEQPANMLRRVDRALYASKAAGRNCSHWHDGREVHSSTTDTQQEHTNNSQNQPTDKPNQRVAERPPSVPAARSVRQHIETSSQDIDNDLEQPLSNELDRTVFFARVRQRIAEWQRAGARFSVILVQVDDYDRVVATHGQPLADRASQITRRLLTSILREMDIVGHYRHGCHALLLPQTRLSDAVMVAERICQCVAQCGPPASNATSQLTVSLGIAEVSEIDDAKGLLQRTESALSAAGRNGVAYHDGQQPIPTKSDAHLSGPAMCGTQG